MSILILNDEVANRIICQDNCSENSVFKFMIKSYLLAANQRWRRAINTWLADVFGFCILLFYWFVLLHLWGEGWRV